MTNTILKYDTLITLASGHPITLAPGDRIEFDYFEQPSSSNTIRIDTVVTPGTVDLRLYPNASLMACNDTLNSCTLAIADVANWYPKTGVNFMEITATPTVLVFEVGPGFANCWLVNNSEVDSYDLEIFAGPYV